MNGRELKKILQEYLFEKLEFDFFYKGRDIILLPANNIITIIIFDNRSYDNDGFYLCIHSFPLYNEKDFIAMNYGYNRIKWLYRKDIEKDNGNKLAKLIHEYVDKIRKNEDPKEFYKYMKSYGYLDQLNYRKNVALTACLIRKENYLEQLESLRDEAQTQKYDDGILDKVYDKIEQDCQLLLELHDLDKIQEQLQKWRKQTIKNLGFDKFID